MNFTKICLLLQATLLATLFASGQTDNNWTLQRAIEYANANNLTIQQNVLNARVAELRSTQMQLSQLPNINASTLYGKSFGRSINPVTNEFVDANYNFATLTGNADVLLFGWFQKRNLIAQGKLIEKATDADVDQVRNDVSLNLATAYLRTALAKEQIEVSKKQIAFSKKQLEQTKIIVATGVMPELEVLQIESQMSADSTKLMTAIADYNASIIDIKAILNLDIETPFNPQVGVMDMQQSIKFINTAPEEVYRVAQQQMGSIRSSNLRVQAAEKFYKASQGAMLPQLGLLGQWGTNYSSLSKQISSTGFTNAQVSGSYVDVNGNQYPIYQISPVYSTSDIPFGRQLSNNSRSNVAVTLTIPIFNGWRMYTGMKEARIQLESEKLNKRATEVAVKQGVYNAYNEAKTSLQKYYAAERAEMTAQKAFSYMQQRYEVGLDNTINYLLIQNNLFNASFIKLSAQYELMLKTKILDYYMGRPITL